jgi:hypothetical protein
MSEYLQPVAECVYPEEMRKSGFIWQHTFLVRYEPGKETSIRTHADDSELTVSLSLSLPPHVCIHVVDEAACCTYIPYVSPLPPVHLDFVPR